MVVTSPSTALCLSDSGETYTCTATTVGVRCTCPARAAGCHVVAALCAWAAVYQPARDLPWMAEPDVFAEERRSEMAASFYEQQQALWGPAWRMPSRRL